MSSYVFYDPVQFPPQALGAGGNFLYSAEISPLPAANVVSSFAHGLGVVPAFAEVELVCKVADGGYAVGDVITSIALNSSSMYVCPITLARSSTNIFFNSG